jgi:hypothetical protein
MPSTSHALILLLLAGCSPLVVDFKDGVPTDDGIGTDSGSAVAPDISVDPPAIDFGVVLVGETATATFTVANVGDAPLTTALVVDGDAFSITTTTVTLLGDASAVVDVTFAAGPVGAYVGTVTVTSDDPDEPTIVVDLSGEVGADADGDGFSGSDDCDDADPAVNPSAEETWYDGVDQDCSGTSDYDADQDGADAAAYGGADCDDTDAAIGPDAPETWYDGVDQDCDGRSDNDQDGDGHDAAAQGGDDCDDTDAGAYPGHLEDVGNGVDDDCDGEVDETLSSVDTDGDGYSEVDGDCLEGDASVSPGASEVWYDGVDQDCSGGSDYDQDGDGVDSLAFGGDDCDDLDATVLPGASEAWYDGVDQDCSGGSDYDQDGDSHDSDLYGGDDCADTDAAVNPDVVETWYDGVDADCSGASDYDADADGFDADAYGGADCDDLTASTNPDATETWYDGLDADCSGTSDYDADADGFDAASGGGDDCDDTDASVNPAATEAWYDGLDADCSGGSDYDQDGDGEDSAVFGGTDCDDADATVNAAAIEVWYDGIDGDCSRGSDYDQDGDGEDSAVFGGADCDDTDGSVNSTATELWYDGVDQDCSGGSDYDQDVDGFDATAAAGDDCDDLDGSVNPSAAEECDGVDQNCDGAVDEGVLNVYYADADGDLYGDAASSVEACDAPLGYSASSTDCDDGVAAVNPGARETCNTTDDDCDGSIDEGLATSTYYRDADSDGYGDAGYSATSCTIPRGYVADATDCDDGDATSNPGAGEISYDTADNDCDGYPDDMLAASESGWTVIGERTTDNIGSGGVYITEDLNGDGDLELVIASGNANAPGYTDIGILAFHDVDTAGLGVTVSGGYLEVYGNSSDDYVGSAFAVLGDIDGGGVAEVLVGAYQNDIENTDDGTVYVLDIGGESGARYASSLAEGAIYGDASNGWTGYALATGDFDGDGTNEAVTGAPGEQSGKGQVYVSFLADGIGTDAIDNTDSQFYIRGVSDADHLGYSVAMGELSGDGYDDLVACAPDDDDGGSGSGTCWIVPGSTTRDSSTSVRGSTVTSVYSAVITGSAASDQAGKTPQSLSVGDFDDDGFLDLAVGMPGYDGYATDGGAVLLYRNGTLSGSETVSTTSWLLRGDGALGTAVNMTSDVTGDGVVDLLGGATTAGPADEGVVYLFAGDAAIGTWTLPTDQYASWTGESTSDAFGAAISNVDDLDGDGRSEFAVSATGDDDGASNAGKVYVIPAYP